MECQVYVKGNTAGNVVVLDSGGVRWSVRFMLKEIQLVMLLC